jgi:hypothetical protein
MDIHDHDVGAQLHYQGYSSLTICCFTHYGKARYLLEQLSYPLSDDTVVFNE